MSSVIVVDSSAFIEYYRPSGSPKVQATVAEAIASERVATNGIIQVEILAFAPDQASYRKLQADFQAFHWLNLGSEEFALATELGFQLRRLGITVPPTISSSPPQPFRSEQSFTTWTRITTRLPGTPP